METGRETLLKGILEIRKIGKKKKVDLPTDQGYSANEPYLCINIDMRFYFFRVPKIILFVSKKHKEVA